MNTEKSKLEAQKENFAEKEVNKISSNLPVINRFCGCPDDGYIMYVMGIKKCIRCGTKERNRKNVL
jgi:hypothetical protein